MSSDEARDLSNEEKTKSESSSCSTSSTSVESPEKCRTLTINSPAAGDPLVFQYKSPNAEFVDILKLAVDEFEGLKQVVAMSVGNLDHLYTADYEALDEVCWRFNKAASTISNLWKGATKPGSNTEFASTKLLNRILTHSYNKAVDNEKALNKHYEAFSSETYGETSFNRMQMIIDELKPTNQDVFVDLGSGVGQLVAHMAGGSKVKKAFGIEIAQLPAKFAAKLEEEFRKLMKFFGKKVRPFSLERGNFLESNYRELITQDATIIFINNYAFQSDLEAKIKQNLLSELKNGTRIISTKPYGALNKNITERQLNDISSILDVVELKRCPNPCSWTSNDVPYYLHVVNHEKLEKYFLSLKNNNLKLDLRRSATPSSKNSDSRESSVPRKSLKKKQREYDLHGPTTRRKWQAYVSEVMPEPKVEAVPSKKDETMSDKASNDSDSDFEEKKRKKSVTVKVKGRPRRSADKKDISNDAEEGIELMHKLICEATELKPESNGQSKAELKPPKKLNKKKEKEKEKVLPEISVPFPSVGVSGSVINALTNDTANGEYKYPNLEVFLSELRRVYEGFLDNVKPNGSNTDNAINVPKVPTNKLGHCLVDITRRMDTLRTKYLELGSEIDSLRADVINLVTKFSHTDMPTLSKKLNGDIHTPSTSNPQVIPKPYTGLNSTDNKLPTGIENQSNPQLNGALKIGVQNGNMNLINALTSLMATNLNETVDLNSFNQMPTASPVELNPMTADFTQRNQLIYNLLSSSNAMGMAPNSLLALRSLSVGTPQASFDTFSNYSNIATPNMLPQRPGGYTNDSSHTDQRKRQADMRDDGTSAKRFHENGA
ncbi:unnamed protein product [Bursaphelenchus okinawaensis]|uniref:Histone-lysine N-methyltransferase, H3 lysine-79 specific n=1 Tax=Bursaphelenchus okinawaensis TaxID=465554 RepID=A0A811JU97_9BILA|nr:unnamed protein product [Bursaphelenchus okinawaensis]CAG9082873.1 unnamed protein product [Bursaphelenchus okinawaensis]